MFFHGGWGKISAAASTQYVLDRFGPDLLVNLGTCGGLEGRIERGAVILVDRTVVYDIVEQMTEPLAALAHYATDLDVSWLRAEPPTPVRRGQMLSADRDILPEDVRSLTEKYGAVAGDWESGAIAWVAKRNGVRCLILRAVSDLVSAEGGEAYEVRGLFAQRTAEIMVMLVSILPVWLAAICRPAEPPTTL